MSTEPAAASEARPRRMLDRYEIVAEIARGGMGTVLLARLEGAGGFERLMAIKLMHEHLATDEQFVTMLLDEARTAAAIHHPNAVGIVDVASSAVGYYLVMSYVEGFTLSQLVSHPELDARERIRLGLRVLIDACHGLHAAHTAKDAKGKPLAIVHRDVSPQNVLVGLDGVGRIVDFGIALAASRVTSSRTGVLKGKPSYMAPEQVKSEPTDARADVFALGIIAWEILTGERLFVAEVDLATLLQVLEAKIAPPSAKQPLVPEALDAVVLKALARAVSDRTPDARTLGVELERAADAAGLLAPTHLVADTIEKLFARQIEARQEAIRHHLSSSSGEKKPLQPGQLGLIPSLYDRGPVQRSAEVDNRDTHSGVRERRSSADAIEHAPTVHGSTPPPSSKTAVLEPPPAPIEGAPKPKGRPLALSVVLGAVGVALIGIALAIVSWPSDAPRAVTEAPTEPVVDPEPAIAEEPSPTPPEPEAIAAPEPLPVEPPAPTIEAPPIERARNPRRVERETEAPREVEAPSEPSPTLETNPYLVR